MQLSFKEFLQLDEATQQVLGSPYVASYDKLSDFMKKRKMDQLESLLKKANFLYFLSDDTKVWKSGHEMENKIRTLVDFIGKDGMYLFRQYARIAGLFDTLKRDCEVVHQKPDIKLKNEDVSGGTRIKKLKALEVLLKRHDWWYSMSDDGRAWDKGRKQADDIHQLIKDIGDEGKQLYKKYGKKAGVFEKKESLFPEMDSVQRTSHGYSDNVRIKGQPFTDVGLYENSEKFTPPTDSLKKRFQKGSI